MCVSKTEYRLIDIFMFSLIKIYPLPYDRTVDSNS